MPNFEPVVLEGRTYQIRHVGPQSALWPDNPSVDIGNFVLLNQATMAARPLPWSNTPNAPDWVSGQWIGRLNDAGEFSLTFPNKEASDGQPWRLRFDPSGKNQWIEIWNDGYLEGAYCIQKMELKQDQIIISGNDGWYQLKSAYERDWAVVQAPRDVIERGTNVEIPMAADDFTSPALDSQWGLTLAPGGTVTIKPTGPVVLTATAAAAATAGIRTAFTETIIPTRAWRASCSLLSVAIVENLGVAVDVTLSVTESSGASYGIMFTGKHAFLLTTGVLTQAVVIPSAAAYSMVLESDGEWILGFVNGLLVGCIRRATGTTNELSISIVAHGQLVGSATATVVAASLTALQSFLMQGIDKGDYVLPGTATTYPNGGLHARYFNNLDLQSDTNRLIKIHSPPRTAVYSGSGSSEYINQQDATINNQANPLPGASTSGWSVIWFGAIYLKLSAGNYQFSLATSNNTAVRAWIGKTAFGDQLVEQWTFAAATTYNFTVTAADLAGYLPYGTGTVIRDGWYPIKIEAAIDSTAAGSPILRLTNSPSAYTDPGGTAIASGAQSTVVPATSLSPLGIVDQRYQGISHFDLVQKTAQAFGYQLSCEPYQLESINIPNGVRLGAFPGVLAPRIREGHDTDGVLEPDITPRSDGEGLIGYGNLLDATDNCSSLQGNGAGFQNGSSGQLQSEVFDTATLRSSLFNVQGWQDFSDASFSSLLTALLNSEIGLRLAPWQTVTGQPMGKPRLAFSWPLPSALAQMRWRPGDGLRVQARDIRIFDLSPRQLLVVTRSIHPNGATGTQVTFASRPRTDAHALKKQVFTATRWQRNYQKQLVTLSSALLEGTMTGGAGNQYAPSTGFPPYAGVFLSPGDQVLRARVRLAMLNGVTPSVGIQTWSGSAWVDQTTSLGGPWSTVPVNIDISSVLTISTDNRALINFVNKTAQAVTQIDFQLLIDVLR